MNLRKMLFWTNTASPQSQAESLPMAFESPKNAISNVISLPTRSPLDVPTGLETPLTELPVVPTATPKPRGLLDAPELKKFFADNYFGVGRHNGANYKTHDALTLGKQSLVSKFQNTLAEVLEQKQFKIDRLRNMALQTEGICETTSSQLQLACTNLEREISTLRDQSEKSAEGKGWVLEALNRYQIGFGKGLREAIDFEMLAN